MMDSTAFAQDFKRIVESDKNRRERRKHYVMAVLGIFGVGFALFSHIIAFHEDVNVYTMADKR